MLIFAVEICGRIWTLATTKKNAKEHLSPRLRAQILLQIFYNIGWPASQVLPMINFKLL